ncbi:hypothetical protein M427DRAFT_60239 [Gonapodya prolifera JEL478]|uniref:Uncharacterized protein n=1 Tax=Gonapodya prolifera (strain JEL478) TaxID=1344416 RepID=A0A139A5N3_GONPJ|nr:hypothetical protein M427DRAFT_60239 [Gonapodya prolifera JEL478]|eukprot:KXS11785.1 hypothetical protein M427DRAFT_60239 [Gonapodya prolifera JEL478]
MLHTLETRDVSSPPDASIHLSVPTVESKPPLLAKKPAVVSFDVDDNDSDVDATGLQLQVPAPGAIRDPHDLSQAKLRRHSSLNAPGRRTSRRGHERNGSPGPAPAAPTVEQVDSIQLMRALERRVVDLEAALKACLVRVEEIAVENRTLRAEMDKVRAERAVIAAAKGQAVEANMGQVAPGNSDQIGRKNSRRGKPGHSETSHHRTSMSIEGYAPPAPAPAPAAIPPPKSAPPSTNTPSTITHPPTNRTPRPTMPAVSDSYETDDDVPLVTIPVATPLPTPPSSRPVSQTITATDPTRRHSTHGHRRSVHLAPPATDDGGAEKRRSLDIQPTVVDPTGMLSPQLRKDQGDISRRRSIDARPAVGRGALSPLRPPNQPDHSTRRSMDVRTSAGLLAPPAHDVDASQRQSTDAPPATATARLDAVLQRSATGRDRKRPTSWLGGGSGTGAGERKGDGEGKGVAEGKGKGGLSSGLAGLFGRRKK